MAQPKRGEVWLVDLGLAAKVRPCLLFTDFPADDELALVSVVPHTTAIRGNRWEVACEKSFLKPGAFHLQRFSRFPSPNWSGGLENWIALKWARIAEKLS